MEPVMLKINSLKVTYGGIQVVKGVDLGIRESKLVALIGTNGVGKTTAMKAITDLQGWADGSVQYLGKSIKGVPSYNLLKQGLAMVPEDHGIFAHMTIAKNLQMGAFTRNDGADIKIDIDRMFDTFPHLKERAGQLAGTMSGGEQQMLAMARTLMGQPRLLLLDEPSMGLSPVMVRKIFKVVHDISTQGVTVLLVEQNTHLTLQAAHRGYMIDSGLITMNDGAKQVLDDPKVRTAYLGK